MGDGRRATGDGRRGLRLTRCHPEERSDEGPTVLSWFAVQESRSFAALRMTTPLSPVARRPSPVAVAHYRLVSPGNHCASLPADV
jgi:hypothetical protein